MSGIFARIALIIFLTGAIAGPAWGSTAPHGDYDNSTDFCLACHDIHEAQGDYVLTRESTVTAVCGTCHGLFGALPPGNVNWSDPPSDFAGANPTASTLMAYKVSMNTMAAAEADAVPGHSLGVMYGGAVVRASDAIPGGGAILKVMTSGQYGGPSLGLYGGQSVTSFDGTNGLYCASCHTPHSGSLQSSWFGQARWFDLYTVSSKPNHSATATDDSNDGFFCLGCHDRRGNQGAERNHPHAEYYCTNCHYYPGDYPYEGPGDVRFDFPHTSPNQRLLSRESPDVICKQCHPAGRLP